MSTANSQFSRIQNLVNQNPAILPSLLQYYRGVFGPCFTRDLRWILEECIHTEVFGLLYDVDLESEENKVLLLQPKTGMAEFVKNFHRQVNAHFTQQIPQVQGFCSDKIGDMYVLAHEDRKLCFDLDFSKFLADEGYSFLSAVRKILNYEAQLLRKALDPMPRQIVLLKRQFKSDTISEKTLVLTDFKRRCLDAGRISKLDDIKVALDAFDVTDFMTKPENLKPSFEAIDELNKLLSLSFKRSVVNDKVQRFDLESCNESIELELEKTSTASSLVNLSEEFKTRVSLLLSKSLLVLNQSFQVIREKKYLSFEVQLMFNKFFSRHFKFDLLNLEIALLNETNLQNLEAGSFDLARLRELAKTSNISVRDSKHLQLKFGCNFISDISLHVFKLPHRENPVWAQKFVFCFFAHCQINGYIYCLSRPVTFITNDNQRMDSTACIAYENAFPMPIRSGFKVLKSVEGSGCVDMIDRYIFEETGRGLNADSRLYFLDKCQSLMQKTGNVCITFDDLIKVQFIGIECETGKLRSLWDFTYSCVKFIKDHAQKLWVGNLLCGFISKTLATEKIRRLLESPDRCGSDFALLRFSETTATVTVCYSTVDNSQPRCTKIQHLTPKPESYFSSVPLVKFCDDPLSPLTQVVTHSGSLENSAVLREMIPREENVPGYVALRKIRDAGPDFASDLASSIASVSVYSPCASEAASVIMASPLPGGPVSFVSEASTEPNIPDPLLDFVLEHT